MSKSRGGRADRACAKLSDTIETGCEAPDDPETSNAESSKMSHRRRWVSDSSSVFRRSRDNCAHVNEISYAKLIELTALIASKTHLPTEYRSQGFLNPTS